MDCAPADISGAQTRHWTERIRIHLKFLLNQGYPYFQLKLAGRLLPWFRRLQLPVPRSMQDAAGLQNKEIASRKASEGYQPTCYKGKVLLLRALQRHPFQTDERVDLGWGRLVNNLVIRNVPGDHHSMLKAPNVQVTADYIDEQL
jgi:thioesterase domain-containing protein